MLVNGNQVVTMNGNYLQINSDCGYTLAEDFENRTFAVVANIQNGKTASIAISSGPHVIEILPDPQQVDDTNRIEFDLNLIVDILTYDSLFLA